jgi:hypothetical protein
MRDGWVPPLDTHTSWQFLAGLLAVVGFLLAGCASASASILPTASATSEATQTSTATPPETKDCTLQGGCSSSDLTPTASPIVAKTVPTAIPALKATNQPQAAVFPTPCPEEQCLYPLPYPLARPIAPPGRDRIDTSYRFASTQKGTRDPHHGVEFLNSSGTPVLAAGDGSVVVAGDDRQVLYGPYPNFYGNLVVIEHRIAGYSHPLYSLYGHLSQISVQVGERVQAGDQIGLVGMSGVATGSHLHFEVRLGENSYQASRNPELWLAPLSASDGSLYGALAGRILDSYGNLLEVENIVVEHLSTPEGPGDWQVYVTAYEEKALSGNPPWEENFAVGDLPAGWYRVSFVKYGMRSRVVQVLPGEITLATFRVAE